MEKSHCIARDGVQGAWRRGGCACAGAHGGWMRMDALLKSWHTLPRQNAGLTPRVRNMARPGHVAIALIRGMALAQRNPHRPLHHKAVLRNKL
eukprot:3962403-Lingulodinium_polyedra.AAC.1